MTYSEYREAGELFAEIDRLQKASRITQRKFIGISSSDNREIVFIDDDCIKKAIRDSTDERITEIETLLKTKYGFTFE